MSQGMYGLSGSQEEWRPELRFARRKTTKREWNFVHNLDTIASSSISISKNSKRNTRLSTVKISRNKLDNEIENVSAIEIPENAATQQSSTTRQRLTSNGADDSSSANSMFIKDVSASDDGSSANGMFTKDVSASIMGSTPKPGKEQRSRKKMVSLSQYQISVSEQIEEEEKRKQEPNQNTPMALKQDHGNKFYRNISTQDYNLTSNKSSRKNSSGLSKQSSSKKMEELHLEEMKENSIISLTQNSLRKRLRSVTSDKGRIEAENSQAVLKQESQPKRLKSVSAKEKKVEAVKSQVPYQHESVHRGKRQLSHEKDDVGKEGASKQKKKGIFSVQPISPTSQNITQSTPLSLKYNKEHERVEVKQHDERLRKKTVAMENSVGACAVYMWNAGEMKRGAKDITDLDVALDCIIKTLESERDHCPSQSRKKVLSYLQTYMKKEIRDMIRKHHDVRKIQSSIKKKNSQILHLRKELLKIQKKRFRQIGDHAKGKRDNSARNAQKISNCLAQLEAFVKEMPSKTMMERKNSRRLIQLKMVTVGYFPSVA